MLTTSDQRPFFVSILLRVKCDSVLRSTAKVVFAPYSAIYPVGYSFRFPFYFVHTTMKTLDAAAKNRKTDRKTVGTGSDERRVVQANRQNAPNEYYSKRHRSVWSIKYHPWPIVHDIILTMCSNRSNTICTTLKISKNNKQTRAIDDVFHEQRFVRRSKIVIYARCKYEITASTILCFIGANVRYTKWAFLK